MIFFLSQSPLILTPLCGPYPMRVILFFVQVHPLQLLRRRLSVIADDVVVAVLVLQISVVQYIWANLIELPRFFSPRGCVFDDSHSKFLVEVARYFLTFFRVTSMLNIYARFHERKNSRLKKTWHAASFEPWSDEDENLRSKQSPSELSGPSLIMIYSVIISIWRDYAYHQYKRIKINLLPHSAEFFCIF